MSWSFKYNSQDITIQLTLQNLLVMFLALVSFLLAFSPVWKNLFHVWATSEDYSHGFFIVPITLLIIWQKRTELANSTAHPSWLIFPLVLVSVFIYIFAHLAGIATVSSYSMILFLISSTWFLYGRNVLQIIIFPLFLLFFMVPAPAQVYATLTIPLQLLVSKASVWLTSLMAVPILREGNIIHIPEHTLEVVQACSGLRSMVSLLGLSVLFAYFTLRSNLLRTLLFLSGVPVAIAVNIVRVVAMIIALHFYSVDLTAGALHSFFGTAIFVLALILVAILRGVLAHWDTITEIK